MAEHAEGRSPSSTTDRTRPRLGLAPLSIWIALSCAYLVIAKELSPRSPTLLGTLQVLMLALCVGAAWTGSVLLALRAWRSQRWTVEAGDWLLVLLGAGAAIEIVLEVLSTRAFSRPELVLMALECWLFVLPSFSRKLNARWKAFFFLVVLLYAIPLILGCLAIMGLRMSAANARIVSALIRMTAPVAAGSLVTTSVLDHRAGTRHDWIHWCGVIVFLLMMTMRWSTLTAP